MERKTEQVEQHASRSMKDRHDLQKAALVQINPITFQYIKANTGTFLKTQQTEDHEPITSSTVEDSHYIRKSYHPHTVVFDSPGCENMLLQMKRTFDVRHHGGTIDLKHLDITSYLSAPNRINTCHSHLGTVYRIFPDLSDMGWIETNTALYNLATHSMDKIVESFAPQKRMKNDNTSEPKILEVIDWPVTAGLTGGPEYDDFFKWAKNLNNYNPEEKDISYNKVPKCCHPLRYQTKAYDKCTKSLSAFTQDEREFMECYHWLRHMPELFKPDGLYSEFNNDEAENEAKQKLRNFQLDNGNVRCPDASKLDAICEAVS
jgi:hypothetical protein